VSGEEEFVIQMEPSGEVVATIRAVSRPDSALAKLGVPVTRHQQRQIAQRYLSALPGVR
jgi:uncharacterized protein (UPF0548 family)